MSKRVFHIADDIQRSALIRAAMQKAVDLAYESFYHAMMVEGLDDESLALFAQEAWEPLAQALELDYPQYARRLYVNAYQLAYRTAMRELPDGRHPNIAQLAQAFERELGLMPEHTVSRPADELTG